MKLSRCLLLALAIALPVDLRAQSPGTTPAPAGDATRFPGDERQTKLAERYRAMLLANPSEGTALDRLWKLWDEQHATAALIDSFAVEVQRQGTAPKWLVYGHFLKRAGRLEEAAKAYEQAATLDPAGFQPGVARGELALARQDFAAAAPLLSEAINKLPLNDSRRAELRLKLGGAWLAAGQPEKAAESWEQAVAETPANLPLRRQIAETYARNRLTERALFHYEYLAGHDTAPQRAAALREMGRMRENRGEFDAARGAFERALGLTSRDNWLHGELLTAIIRLYERAGRGTELAERWRRDAAQSPRDLGGLLRLEKLAETLGDAPGQREWLEKIVALAPRDRDSRLKLARVLADLGEREKAAATYDALLVDQPGRLDLLMARSELDIQAGRLDAAAKRLEDRAATTPDDETTSTPVLEFFLAHRLDGPAERLLQRLVGIHPKTVPPNLALAKFYLTHQRTDDARVILDPLADQLSTEAAKTECWQQVASLYRDSGQPEDALRTWRRVETALPGSPVPRLAVADLLLASGESEGAAKELERAAELSPEGAEREAAERRLFDVLSSFQDKSPTSKVPPPTLDLRRRRVFRLTPPGEIAPATSASNERLARYLVDLELAAKRDPTPANRLRFARWQAWAHASTEAADTLEEMVADNPASVPARQQLVDLAMAAKQYDIAQRHLRELLRLDADRKNVYLRQLASLHLERGDAESALSVYGELAQAQPGSADALSDLALALQRADRWLDALETWKRAYALPAQSPAQRIKILRPLVAVYEHLTDFKTAAEALLATADAQSDPSSRQELVRDLSDFCRRHELSTWLDETFERRWVMQPDDYPTLMALAELRKAQGRVRDVCELLSRAYYSAPDPVVALKALTEAAESAGENDRAVAAWRRLLGLPGQNTPTNLQRLAALEENDLDENAATQTWEAIVARFPRDVGTLIQASEFFERVGQVRRACSLLGGSLALEPADPTRLFHLGELEREAGNPGAARGHFETLLARTETPSSNAPIALPDDLEAVVRPSMALLGGGMSAPPKATATGRPERGLRLRAIRELARLLPPLDTPGNEAKLRRDWSLRWHQAAELGAREESLAALYGSGESDAVMDLLERWMAEAPTEERLRSAYLQAGLRLHDYRRLALWAWPVDDADREVARGTLLIEALQQFLARDGEPDEAIGEALFPSHVRARDLLWQAASSLAERHWYRQAAQLGERVTRLTALDNASNGFETARWWLLLGDIDRARTLLREVVAQNEVSYDGTGASATLESLRVFYGLLPEGEQAAFTETYLRGCRERGEAVAEMLSGVLLHGLHGDEALADAALDRLLECRLLGGATGDPAESRRWVFVLFFGNQLQNWRLEKMALHWWRGALRELDAFDRADGGLQSTLAEIRSRLFVQEVRLSANPAQTTELVVHYLRQSPAAGVVSSAASQLLALGQAPAARQLYGFLVKAEPNDGDHWRNYLSVCEALGDSDAAERALQTMLDHPDAMPPAFNRAEVARLLASWRRKGGDAPGAIRLLERECYESGGSNTIFAALAYSYENAKMYDEATRVWQAGAVADPGRNQNFRLALARLEESRGRMPQAIGILRQEQTANPAVFSGEGPLRLASLYLKSGQSAEARQLAQGAADAQEFPALLEFARTFARENQHTQARELFALGAKRCRDANLQFRFQQEWLQMKERPPGESPADYVRGLRRLRQIAQWSPALGDQYAAARYPLARVHGADAWLEHDLQREWRDGLGDPMAGQSLAKLYLDAQRPDSLRQLVEVAWNLPGGKEPFLSGIANLLVDGNVPALALPIYEKLVRRFPQNEAHVINLALCLGKSGQTEAAIRLLDTLNRAGVVRGNLTMQIADAYRRLNQPELAASLLRHAAEDDPAAARLPQAYVQLAQEAAGHGDWRESRRLLSAASHQPAATKDLRPLVECLFGSGELDRISSAAMPGREFALTFPQRAELLAAIYQRLKQTNHPVEAGALLMVNHDFLPGSPTWAQEAQADVALGQMPDCVASLEQAVGQSPLALPRTTRILASFYVRWAALEANDGASAASRLLHLTRANQLVPQDFEVARQLALLDWEQGAASAAVAVLQPFLKPEAVPVEREQARQILAKH